MAGGSVYHIVTYPRPNPISILDEATINLARKLQRFRLEALKQAPEAFGSSYEVEERRGLELTVERLCNQKATTFVAVRGIVSSDTGTHTGDDNSGTIAALLNAEWVGLSSIVGPEDNPTLHIPWAANGSDETTGSGSSRQLCQDLNCVGYHIGGTYVSQSARRSGVGQKLISKCLARAFSEGKQCGKRVLVQIAVFDDNNEARGLYEKCGFRVVGKETREQQPRLIEGEMMRKQKMFLNMEIILG